MAELILYTILVSVNKLVSPRPAYFVGAGKVWKIYITLHYISKMLFNFST